jgi:7-carboxy-7-deazaguanine synthase
MIVNEIFTSIQGESSRQGLPFSFVRLTGCNLRCIYCDTTYAYEGGRLMDIQEIATEVEKRGLARTLITGGEPLIQDETPELIDLLANRGFGVSLETNGSFPLSSLNSSCTKIVDVKTPGSGAGGSFLEDNLSCLGEDDEIKFVLTCREDFDFARTFIDEKLRDFPGTVLFSPAWGLLKAETLAQWMIKERLDLRLNLQLHKFIFGSGKRGV